MVVVAQLVRALVCGAGGRGFESHHPPFNMKTKSFKTWFFCTIFLYEAPIKLKLIEFKRYFFF
jgi:hypothetical protein